MVRTIAFVASGAFAVSAVVMTPATARAKAVTGNVNCTLVGKAVITPGLPLASPGSATKTVKTTVTFTGTLSACTGTQMGTKGGLPIDGGTLSAVAKTKVAKGMDLPSCVGLSMPTTPTVLKAKVTFTSGGMPIAVSKANLTVGNAVIGTTVSFPAMGPVTGGNGFKGQTVNATAVLDKLTADLANVCAGGASTEFDFATPGASSLQVQ